MTTRFSRLAMFAAAALLAAGAAGCPKKPVKVAVTPTPAETATPAPTATPDLDAQMKGAAESSTAEGDLAACGAEPIHFDLDSSALKPEATATLKSVAACLQAHKTWKTLLEGNADERGGTQYNLALGERRARTVEKWLLDAGIEKARMQTVSYGSEKPVAAGHDESAWAQNRRVEFRITQK